MEAFDKCQPCRKPAPFGKGRARMPDIERPEFCRTQNKQSVHKPSEVRGEGYCGVGGVCRNGDDLGGDLSVLTFKAGGRFIAFFCKIKSYFSAETLDKGKI